MFGQPPKSIFTELPGFESIPAAELAILASVSTPVDVAAGRVVMREGAPGSEALIVLEGELVVEKHGETIAAVGPGGVVGEMALLSNEPRNASVTAVTPVRVVTLNRREFATVLERCPALARRILTGAVERAGQAVA